MRIPRLKPADRTAVYHCLSRTVGGQPLLGPAEREQFRRCLWRQAQFCGIQLITYAVLNNHFHLLARVPHRQPPTDRELLQRVSGFYGPKAPLTLRLKSQLHHQGRLTDKERVPLLRRMGDISVFMKELKQGFSRWYNQRHQRYGTLWAERFKSLLVEDQPGVVGTVAAYIDLNAVRAGLVSDPKDYRFCGYAEAVAGGALAREGLMSLGRPGVGRRWRRLIGRSCLCGRGQWGRRASGCWSRSGSSRCWRKGARSAGGRRCGCGCGI